ncbi:hypothetical protein [Polynucleobacter necessarius]|uniref:hypothetical protein n=1 Tax=Polynucleobacter necessarius TaxID=576610 RepID=UPI000E0998D6|nr:hypothetical protein [Polynucleobacter necessarius]
MNLSRRTFIASAALLPVACGVPLSYEGGVPVSAPSPTPKVRQPQVGQEWIYIKKDVFNGKTLGLITERVVSVGSNIVIERSENGAALPNEIQTSWGFVQTDPQWSKVLNFRPALALWPTELTADWSKQFITKYTVAGYPDGELGWQEYMSAQGWEKITVPAGDFIALRFHNLINYESDDPNKFACMHNETIWFAPQIGRWVAREISGSYKIQGEGGTVISENSYQWQLVSNK